MRRVALWLLLVLLLSAGARASEGQSKIPPPKLQDVRVWYYPPSGRPPVTVLWWQPDILRAQRRLRVDRRGSLRVRVLLSGGFEEDQRGLLNWVSIAFRDTTSSLYDLPHEMRASRGGVKDVTWRVPELFAPGMLELEVVAWSGRTPRTSLLVKAADRTGWFILGSVNE